MESWNNTLELKSWPLAVVDILPKVFWVIIIIYTGMVVAQLEVWSLPIPEVRSPIVVVSKIYIEHLFTINCKEKNKKKRPGMAHLKIYV